MDREALRKALEDYRRRSVRDEGCESGDLAGLLNLISERDSEVVRQLGGAIETGELVPNQLLELLEDWVCEERSPLRVGPYELIRFVSAGGMGEVWRAFRFRGYFRQVAIKLMVAEPEQEERARYRFEREIQALARMSHPHIVSFYEAGTSEDGIPFYAMEFIDGVSLTRFCDTHRLDIATRLQLFLQVCRAVAHIHGRGVVHRDLKPDNILVSGTTGDAQVTLVDFGLAATFGGLSHEELSDQARMNPAGTRGYAAPEQWSQEIDVGNDIYSLGVVLRELLIGLPPKPHSAGTSRQRKPATEFEALPQDEAQPIAGARTSSVKALVRMLRGDLDAIVTKAVAVDPLARYSTVTELIEDLEAFLGTTPVRANPTRSWRPLRHLLRRRRVALTIGLLFMVLLVGGFGLLRQSHRALISQETAGKQARNLAESTRIRLETAREMLDQLVLASHPASPHFVAQSAPPPILAQLEQLLDRDEVMPKDAFELRMSLGRAYHGWELFDRAEAQFRQAAETEDLSKQREAQVALAGSLAKLGRPKDARALLDWVESEPPDDKLTFLTRVRGMLVLADIYLMIGKDQEALGLSHQAREILAKSERTADFDFEQLSMVAISRYARAALALGRYNDALPLFREVLDWRVSKFGKENPVTLLASYYLGYALMESGKLNESISLLRENLDALKRVSGPDHRITLNCKDLLGRAYIVAGRYNEAKPIVREVLAAREARQGPHAIDTLLSLNNWAMLLCYEKDFEGAVATIQLLRTRFVAGGLTSHPQFARILNNTGDLLIRQGQYYTAEELLRDVLALKEKLHGRDHHSTRITLVTLGEALQAQGNCTEALPLFSEAYLGEKKDGRKPDAGIFGSLLLDCLIEVKQLEEARAVFQNVRTLLEAYPGLQSHIDTIEHRLKDVENNK